MNFGDKIDSSFDKSESDQFDGLASKVLATSLMFWFVFSVTHVILNRGLKPPIRY